MFGTSPTLEGEGISPLQKRPTASEHITDSWRTPAAWTAGSRLMHRDDRLRFVNQTDCDGEAGLLGGVSRGAHRGCAWIHNATAAVQGFVLPPAAARASMARHFQRS